MYNEFEENKNINVEENTEEINIPNQENYSKTEAYKKIIEEKNKSVEKKNEAKNKAKKKSYKDFGLTPAQILKFTKIAQNDLKIEEIEKLINVSVNKLSIENAKVFLEDIEEKIKNSFEDIKNKSKEIKEEKKIDEEEKTNA
ncbi:hypothetical protein [Fusobacterium hwasookii]|uniref:Uncharacterized protein n=1 Tax=Fusobacterium hwasookii ChDC F128 TaxID=1216362 RepID=A0ABP2R1R1_9FUSO|nr:hypothetical protein [Fusobacterium hwasookii]EJU06718.1 hypothetical protein B437_11027 [Fusobacterium hwasookii ChDC F128]QNE67361.1 hypothetical protein H5V36_11330 [Fusobacterium hwasookii]